MSTGTVLVAHPSADLYGSDLQLVESVRGLTDAGWRVVVCLPADGPLSPRLREAGGEVTQLDVPVLRKSLLSPLGLLHLLAGTVRALPRMLARLRRERPDVVYVNTVTIPLWLLAARLSGRPALAHVHEAEQLPKPVSLLLNTPLRLARTVVVNSRATADTVLGVVPGLEQRTTLVHNGVAGPGAEPSPAVRDVGAQRRIVIVGRLSARKGTDVALEALALLRAEGHDVDLQLCGSVFPGYEWYERQLRVRAAEPDLAGHVHFAGYTSPTWPALAGADVVVLPSFGESFGNAAVEAQLAGRPVVASDVQALREIITSGETGILVPPGNARALADAVATVLEDGELAAKLAAAGRASARQQFTVERYRSAIVHAIERMIGT